MEIQIDPHTLLRVQERGATEAEIRDVIGTGESTPAKSNRSAKFKIFPFKQHRLGKYYEEKRVEVVYTIEGGIAVTVTVYVFYGKWGN